MAHVAGLMGIPALEMVSQYVVRSGDSAAQAQLTVGVAIAKRHLVFAAEKGLGGWIWNSGWQILECTSGVFGFHPSGLTSAIARILGQRESGQVLRFSRAVLMSPSRSKRWNLIYALLKCITVGVKAISNRL
jgi:hypothetical protein